MKVFYIKQGQSTVDLTPQTITLLCAASTITIVCTTAIVLNTGAMTWKAFEPELLKILGVALNG